jgi:hypothetical protein
VVPGKDGKLLIDAGINVSKPQVSAALNVINNSGSIYLRPCQYPKEHGQGDTRRRLEPSLPGLPGGGAACHNLYLDKNCQFERQDDRAPLLRPGAYSKDRHEVLGFELVILHERMKQPNRINIAKKPMSRSRKKTPITGITTATSEKDDKRKANRIFRRVTKVQIKKEDTPFVDIKEVSNVWSFDKKLQSDLPFKMSSKHFRRIGPGKNGYGQWKLEKDILF